MRGSTSAAFTAVLFAAGAVFVALALGLESGSRLIPLGVAGPLALLLSFQLVRDLRAPGAVRVTRPDWTAAAWIPTLAGFVLLAGLVPGTAMFVSVYLRRRGREGWPVAIGGGVVTGLVLWLAITRALGAAMPGGIAGRVLASWPGR